MNRRNILLTNYLFSIFLAALGLCCGPVGFLQLQQAAATRLLRCPGFSLLWLLLLWSMGSRALDLQKLLLQNSVVATRRLSSTGSGIVAHKLSCPMTCGILLPGQGIEPMSPALAGEFLITGPPRKTYLNNYPCFYFISHSHI